LRKSSDAGLSKDETTSSSSFLSTSASDHSAVGGFGGGSRSESGRGVGAGAISDAFYPRSRQTSVRPELDDTKGMEIKLSGASVVVGGGSPQNANGESLLSRSASSVLSGRALRMGMSGRKAPNSLGSGSGKVRPSTVSDHSEDLRDEKGGTGPSVIVEPGRPSMYESRWLSEMCKGKDAATVDRFEKW
jgi:hypothetical protein